MVVRSLVCIIASAACLWPFAGKPLPPPERVKLFFTTTEKVDIEIFSFRNRTGDSNYNYLSTTIAEQIAEQIEALKEVLITQDDVVMNPVNYERLLITTVVTNTITNITTNTAATSTGTNKSAPAITVTTNIITSVSTNTTTNTALLFMDGESPDNILTLETNETLFNYLGRRVILRGNNNFIRRVSVHDSIIAYPQNAPIEQAVARRKSDMVIYGDIVKKGYALELTAVVVRRISGTARTVRLTCDDIDIDERLPVFCYEVAGRVTAKEKTYNISINATPRDAMCYIDDSYIGKVGSGIYLSTLTVGKHRIVLRKNDYHTIDKTVIFRQPSEETKLLFTMEPSTSYGSVSIETPVTNAMILIDGQRRTAGSAVAELGFGSHSLKVITPGYRDYQTVFDLTSTNRRTIAVIPERITTNMFADLFLNWERNTYVSLYTAAGLGTVALAAYLYATERFDYASTYLAYRGLPSSQLADKKEYKDYLLWNSISVGFTWAAAGMALLGGVSYVFWIASYDFPVGHLTFVPAPDGGSIACSFRF